MADGDKVFFDLRGKLYGVPFDNEEAIEELRGLGATQLDVREGKVRRIAKDYEDSVATPFLYGVGKGLSFNVLPAVLERTGIIEEGTSEAIERAAPGAVLSGEIAGGFF